MVFQTRRPHRPPAMAEENASDPVEKTKVGRAGGQTVLGHLQGFTLHGLEDGFERYGALVASHPLKVITACLVLTLSCGSGLYWFRAENEGKVRRFIWPKFCIMLDLDPDPEPRFHISESLETIFGLKILKFFDADPGSRIVLTLDLE